MQVKIGFSGPRISTWTLPRKEADRLLRLLAECGADALRPKPVSSWAASRSPVVTHFRFLRRFFPQGFAAGLSFARKRRFRHCMVRALTVLHLSDRRGYQDFQRRLLYMLEISPTIAAIALRTPSAECTVKIEAELHHTADNDKNWQSVILRSARFFPSLPQVFAPFPVEKTHRTGPILECRARRSLSWRWPPEPLSAPPSLRERARAASLSSLPAERRVERRAEAWSLR
jgi:hypothetical protein